MAHEADLSRAELLEVITELSGQDVTFLEPLTEGESTRVFRARSRSGGDLVVRVQKRRLISFAEEAWAMTQCREAGVPVPDVLGFRLADDGKGDVMLMRRARGRALEAVLPDLDAAEKERVWTNVGRVLERLHCIPVSSFGFLRETDDHAPIQGADWHTYAQKLLEYREYDVPALQRAGLTLSEIGGLLELVRAVGELPYDSPVLAHGDLGADHIYVDGDLNVVDIIDFGMAQGSAAPLDFGVLHMYHPDIDPAWLIAADPALLQVPGRDLEREALLHKVNVGMSYLAEATRRGDDSFRDIAVFGLRAWLADDGTG